MKENNEGYCETYILHLFPKPRPNQVKREPSMRSLLLTLFLKKSSKECMLSTFNQNEYSTKADYLRPYKDKILKTD